MACRKSSDSRPQILEVSPEAAIPGGELRIRGKNFAGADWPHVRFGELAAPLVIGSDSFLIVKVPEGAEASEVSVGQDHHTSASRPCGIGVQIAEGLHPVANPVIDRQGNIYTTFSGSPGKNRPRFIGWSGTLPQRRCDGSDERHRTGLVGTTRCTPQPP
jgi:hypothetical protein